MTDSEARAQAQLAGGLAAQRARSTGDQEDLLSVWNQEVRDPVWQLILDVLEASEARIAFALGYRMVMGRV